MLQMVFSVKLDDLKVVWWYSEEKKEGIMGDKGKKDKDKRRQQKQSKQAQKSKKK